MEDIFNPIYLGDQMNYEAKTSERIHKGGVSGERDSGRERRECMSDCTKGACFIWCGRIPFWHLVVVTVGLRVTGIWGGWVEVCRLQSIIWLPDTPWHNEGGGELTLLGIRLVIYRS